MFLTGPNPSTSLVVQERTLSVKIYKILDDAKTVGLPSSMLFPISMFPFILCLWQGHQNWLSCEQPQKLVQRDDLQGEVTQEAPHPLILHPSLWPQAPRRQVGWHSPGHTWQICTRNTHVCVSGCLLQSCSAKLLTVPSSCLLLHHCSWDLFALERGRSPGPGLFTLSTVEATETEEGRRRFHHIG